MRTLPVRLSPSLDAAARSYCERVGLSLNGLLGIALDEFLRARSGLQSTAVQLHGAQFEPKPEPKPEPDRAQQVAKLQHLRQEFERRQSVEPVKPAAKPVSKLAPKLAPRAAAQPVVQSVAQSEPEPRAQHVFGISTHPRPDPGRVSPYPNGFDPKPVLPAKPSKADRKLLAEWYRRHPAAPKS